MAEGVDDEGEVLGTPGEGEVPPADESEVPVEGAPAEEGAPEEEAPPPEEGLPPEEGAPPEGEEGVPPADDGLGALDAVVFDENDMDVYFRLAVERGASDLFLQTGHPPMARINGSVKQIHDLPMTKEYATKLFEHMLQKRQQEVFYRDGEIDTSWEVEGVGRFRANVFQARGKTSMVYRHVKGQIPTMNELNLPITQCEKIANLKRGIVFATGITGSGKTTTLASIVDYINENSEKHIVTLEDPIEFVYANKRSLINQREVRSDTVDFKQGLRNVVRQNPDVIMIGECRDTETMEAALAAAETGHLVFTTLHTVNAIQTVERILSFFPPHQHQLIRQQLSLTLKAILSMRLIPRMEGFGRVPAIEILFDTPRIKELLLEGNTKAIGQATYEGREHYGTQTFNQAIHSLYKGGLISFEDALLNSDNPDELKLEIRGISKGAKGGSAFFNQ
ncbi:MAG TPA: PilT/PilU family type 4a pilus ATPase [Planctomycetota bacterium]|nr:PilT/PilU family type 4a pilus ATPase [Planctomycetota bacterium]